MGFINNGNLNGGASWSSEIIHHPRRQGSAVRNSALPLIFRRAHLSALSEMNLVRETKTYRQDDNDVKRENAGAARRRRRTSRRTWKWLPETVRFVSKTIKWLTPSED